MSLPLLLLAGICLLTLGGTSLSLNRLGLPTIISYMALGLALRGLVAGNQSIHFLAEVGIVLLFFLLGLHFPVSKMIDTARRVLGGGILDLILCMGGTTGLLLLLGFDPIPAAFMGSIAYASSSSITLSLLEQRKRLANPEAGFILALLVFEDMVAPILVSLLRNVSSGSGTGAGEYGLLFVYMTLMILGTILFARYGFARLEEFVERHVDRDYLVLLTAGVALTWAGAAVALGLSEVLGAFLAGVMMAETGRIQDLDRIIMPLRNLLLPFFFLEFTASIDIGSTVAHPAMLVGVIVYSLLAKIAVGALGGRLYGLSPLAALRSGFSLLQRGEFSVVIAAAAPPPFNLLGGIYVITTALAGVVSFDRAPRVARALTRILSGGQTPPGATG
ncbi:MAG: cation:proton antiporter [Bacillota bacterium]